MDSSAINLLTQLLHMNPRNRISAQDALMHDYFDDIREQYVYDLIQQK